MTSRRTFMASIACLFGLGGTQSTPDLILVDEPKKPATKEESLKWWKETMAFMGGPCTDFCPRCGSKYEGEGRYLTKYGGGIPTTRYEELATPLNKWYCHDCHTGEYCPND